MVLSLVARRLRAACVDGEFPGSSHPARRRCLRCIPYHVPSSQDPQRRCPAGPARSRGSERLRYVLSEPEFKSQLHDRHRGRPNLAQFSRLHSPELAPGDSRYDALTISNAGTLAIRYKLSTSTSNADGKNLASHLHAEVRSVSGAVRRGLVRRITRRHCAAPHDRTVGKRELARDRRGWKRGCLFQILDAPRYRQPVSERADDCGAIHQRNPGNERCLGARCFIEMSKLIPREDA